jgi:hypothetical protein
MSSPFGCPECGERIALPERPAGRRVRCVECLTLVEIPYFTRNRPRPSRKTLTGWAWVAIVFGLAVIVTVGTYLLVRARLRAEQLSVFESQVALARQEETCGEFEMARNAIDRALDAVEGLGSVDPAQVASLREARERLSHRIEAERREALVLSAEADVAEARDLLLKSPPDASRALELATRAFLTARPLADPRAEVLQDQARELAASLVEQRGVRIDPVPGPFLFEPTASAAEYARRVRPVLSHFLSTRGFLPEPEETPLRDLWERLAPYNMSVSASEAYGPNYLQSRNRTARVVSPLALSRDGRPLWTSYLAAKTRVPSKAFSAFESGYIGASSKREEKVERKLYADALDDFEDQLPSRLRNLPDWSQIAG